MKILTVQGTKEQIANLMQCTSDLDSDRLPNISFQTTSEEQLKSFLKFKVKGGFKIGLSLRPQGDMTSISSSPINICRVAIGLNEYFFGGISEPFYDKLVKKYEKDSLQNFNKTLTFNIWWGK